ncbi:MAG: VWA-like domain-containing protein [Eubacterium sp.]|nr:VWA-like domain-containing protein [Eubacterium sp.]
MKAGCANSVLNGEVQMVPENNKRDTGRAQDPGEMLAGQILQFARDALITRMPYFNRAILAMPVVFYTPAPVPSKAEQGLKIQNSRSTAETVSAMEGQNQKSVSEKLAGTLFGIDTDGYRLENLPSGIGTNGSYVYCDADYVLHLFQKDRTRLIRTWLHMIFHCLFRHPFRYTRLETELWDLAADIAVENAVMECTLAGLELPDDWDRKSRIGQLRGYVQQMTAEQLYRVFQNHRDLTLDLADLFRFDRHEPWMLEDHIWKEMIIRRGGDSVGQKWQTISSGVQDDMDSFEKNQSMLPGKLKKVFREQYHKSGSYESFLKKFARPAEEMYINQDEFDYIYYTYGMQLYRNMPLIEPLEYRETMKIRDFVIALDTSGSCQGRVIRSFLHKTWSVMKTTESFTERIHLHIIQCDSEVRQDKTITSEAEFDQYMKEIEITGSGGTDFRPVFSRVDQLRASGELKNLRGLLYFTDGYGTFPARKPDYPTAFVFVRDRFEIPKVPAWAMRVILEPEELSEAKLQDCSEKMQ